MITDDLKKRGKTARYHQGSFKIRVAILLVLILVLGVFFRTVNLERKIYWEDEIFSSLRISGFVLEEVEEEIQNSQYITAKDLQKYQLPAADKNFGDLIDSLASHPEHSPLYYLIARGVVQVFGYSVALMRAVAALFSLLAFPCVYWLCLELFESSVTGWVAIAVLAVSPFHVLYAQEARQYSLFIVTILLSSATLLRAMRLQRNNASDKKTITAWAMYALSVALGLYSHLLFALVSIVQGIYIIGCQKLRWSQSLSAYIMSSLAGGILFIPWLGVVINNYEKAERAISWMSRPISFFSMMASLVGNSIRIFLDFNLGQEMELKYLILVIIPFLAILFLYVYSLVYLFKHTRFRVWGFIFLLIAVNSLFLVVPDLVLGGQRSTVPRYLIPCYIGIQLAVVYLLSDRMTAINLNARRRKFWQVVTAAVISGGIVSCALLSQAEIWWIKGNNNFLAVARVVNQGIQPLVVSDTKVSYAIGLSYYLDPKVRLQWVDRSEIPTIDKKYNPIFLYYPSHQLKEEIKKESDYKMEAIAEVKNETENIWKLIPQQK